MPFVPDQQSADAPTGRFVPDSGSAPTMFVPSGEKTLPSLTSPEGIAGQPLTRFALGAASPILGAAQLYANIDPLSRMIGADKKWNERAAQLDNAVKEGRVQIGSNGFDWTQAIGTVFSPAILGMAKALPGGMSYLQKIISGVIGGGVAGATTPVTSGANDSAFAKEKAIQTGTGAAVGGAISAAVPPVVGSLKMAYNTLVEPWANPTAIKGRAFLDAAGSKADEIIALLRQNREIVPGTRPFAGEVAAPAGSAEFSNLQRQAAAVTPTPYVAQADQANAARLAALRTVGQDQGSLQAAQTARSAVASPLYQAAREGATPVNTTPITDRIATILEKNPGNRELVNELGNVQKGLADAGTDPQKVASVIDGLKATLANKDNAFIKSTLTSVKNELSNAIPGYQQAQQAFATASEPVNQMQIGQYLEKKLVPALSADAKQKSASYAAAVQDAAGTIKRSTGAPRFDELSQALTPQQMQVVNSIQEDLARGARYEDLAKKGAAAAPNISQTTMEKFPNFLKRSIMIANAIISRLEGTVNKQLASEMAAEMLNPPKVAETLAQAKTRAAVSAAIARDTERAISQGTMGAAQIAAKNNTNLQKSYAQ